MITIDETTGIALGLLSFLLFVGLYVWTALALSAVFRKSGERGWKAWVPILNQVVLLELGRLSGKLFLFVLIPVVGILIVWALQIVACYRINVAFGHGAGMTVLAALLLPVWASILGLGSARWLGTELVGRGSPGGGPRRAPAPDDGAGEYVPRASPALSPAFAVPVRDVVAPAPAPAPLFSPSTGPASSPSTAFATAPSPSPAFAAEPPAPAFAAAPAAPLTRAARRSSPELPEVQPDERYAAAVSPNAEADAGRWGAFDLGAISELTSEVTGAVPGSPDPVSAVSARPAAEGVPAALPPVTRVPARPDARPEAGPLRHEAASWGPVRSPIAAPVAFPESSEPVSAVVGDPAGIPRSARAAVSAQHTKPEIPEDPIDETIITRRRLPAWSLVPPVGPPIPITADVVVLGRKPVPDRAFPSAQLVSIDDGTVSKTHARLSRRDDRWYITDLNSTNGVLFATVLGTEVEAEPGEEVEAGERFSLGDAEVRLRRNDV